MINIKKYMMVATMGLLCSAPVGCTKTEKIYIDELYQKAYVSLGMYPHDHIDFSATYTKGVYQVVDNQLVNSDDLATDGTYPFEFKLFTIYNVKSDLTGTLTLPENAEAFVENYNAANETEYALLPEEYCILENGGTSTIKTGMSISEVPFRISLDLSTEIPDGLYMLPLTCTLDNDKIALSENKGTVWISIDYKSALSDGAEESILPADAGFTVTQSGSASMNNPENLYDGYTNTTCTASVTSSRTAIVTYEFAQPIDLNRIAFVRGGSTSCYVTPAYTYEGESASASLARLTLSSTSPLYSAALPDSDKKVSKVTLTFAGTSSLLSSTITLGEVYFLVKK